MGCDIQVYCEGFCIDENELKWINIDHWYRSDAFAEISFTDTPYSNGFNYYDINQGRRSYHLFYLLAGVRGSAETESYPPISKPRGFPNNMDELIKSYLLRHFTFGDYDDNVDFHDVSYLTLKELKESGYGSPMTTKGWVKEDEFEQDLKLLNEGKFIFLPFIDVKNSSIIPENYIYKEWVGVLNNYLVDIINKMEEYKIQRSIKRDEHIRIVFFFDN